MEHLEVYITMLAIIVIAGVLFSKSPVPTSLILVITGIILSPILNLPSIELDPVLVLNVFLPMLLYQISSFSSWKEVKKNIRPIALLSVGHVMFITCLVAVAVHYLFPNVGWPLAFVMGAVISPPDDVAIVSIAEKIRMPSRIVTILEGEGMFNDATALILFRFALAALITHHFSLIQASTMFVIVMIGETLYGLALGHILGKLRTLIKDPILHMMASLLTPFLAYLPAERLGGSGVLSTVIVGFIIGNYYSVRYTPEFRLLSRSLWPTLSFMIQSFLYLLVGLNIQGIIHRIDFIPLSRLAFYSFVVIGVVVVGRFIWVFPATYLPRLMSRAIRKVDPYPSWQYPFLISWAGMRGSISLAAAMVVPVLPLHIDGANARDLVTFLVFMVIGVTLVLQGLTLPWLLKKLGIHSHGRDESRRERITELTARLEMTRAAIHWLNEWMLENQHDPKVLEEIKLQIQNYQFLKATLREKLSKHDQMTDEIEDIIEEKAHYLSSKTIEIEKELLLQLWAQEKITLTTRNKLLDHLDYRAKYITD